MSTKVSISVCLRLDYDDEQLQSSSCDFVFTHSPLSRACDFWHRTVCDMIWLLHSTWADEDTARGWKLNTTQTGWNDCPFSIQLVLCIKLKCFQTNLIHSNPKSSLHIWNLHCKNVSIKVNFQENYQNIPKKDTFIWETY